MLSKTIEIEKGRCKAFCEKELNYDLYTISENNEMILKIMNTN